MTKEKMQQYNEYLKRSVNRKQEALDKEIEDNVKRIKSGLEHLNALKEREDIDHEYLAYQVLETIDSIKSWSRHLERAMNDLQLAKECLAVSDYYKEEE